MRRAQGGFEVLPAFFPAALAHPHLGPTLFPRYQEGPRSYNNVPTNANTRAGKRVVAPSDQ